MVKSALSPALKDATADGRPDVASATETPIAHSVDRWMKGEMTLVELSDLSAEEMSAVAALGYSMYEQRRYREASVIFEGLSGLDPDEAYYRSALGAVCLAQGELDRAEELFTRAIKMNATDLVPLVNRGELYLLQGKLLEAALDFKRAVDLDPQHQSPFSERARLLATRALNALDEASTMRPGPSSEGTSKKP